jgi:hypothetical protein
VKQDVDGAATIDEHSLKPDTIDAGVEDEGETTRFQNCRPPVRSAKEISWWDQARSLGSKMRSSVLTMLKQARFNSLRSRLDSKDTLPPKMEWTILVGLTYW